eukprot:6246508-Prymnesium_polylepis.1
MQETALQTRTLRSKSCPRRNRPLGCPRDRLSCPHRMQGSGCEAAAAGAATGLSVATRTENGRADDY